MTALKDEDAEEGCGGTCPFRVGINNKRLVIAKSWGRAGGKGILETCFKMLLLSPKRKLSLSADGASHSKGWPDVHR